MEQSIIALMLSHKTKGLRNVCGRRNSNMIYLIDPFYVLFINFRKDNLIPKVLAQVEGKGSSLISRNNNLCRRRVSAALQPACWMLRHISQDDNNQEWSSVWSPLASARSRSGCDNDCIRSPHTVSCPMWGTSVINKLVSLLSHAPTYDNWMNNRFLFCGFLDISFIQIFNWLIRTFTVEGSFFLHWRGSWRWMTVAKFRKYLVVLQQQRWTITDQIWHQDLGRSSSSLCVVSDLGNLGHKSSIVPHT